MSDPEVIYRIKLKHCEALASMDVRFFPNDAGVLIPFYPTCYPECCVHLPMACMAQGLLPFAKNHEINRVCDRAFQCSPDIFFKAIKYACGITKDSINRRASSIRGYALAWDYYKSQEKKNMAIPNQWRGSDMMWRDIQFDTFVTAISKNQLEPWSADLQRQKWICTDIELTLAILSRTVNRMFMPHRTPDYSWDTLNMPCLYFKDVQFLGPGFSSCASYALPAESLAKREKERILKKRDAYVQSLWTSHF